MKSLTLVTLSFLLFQISAYSQTLSGESNNYYPLKVGNVWKYQFGERGSTQKNVITEYFDKYDAYVVENIIKMGDLPPIINRELLELRGDKILVLAAQASLLGGEWEFEDPTKVILQYPLKVGLKWESGSDEERTFCEVVDSLSLRVKAGEFSNVYKIRAIITYKNSVTGETRVFAKTYRYYALNVGLIKQEVISKETGAVTGTFLELIEYKIQ